MMSGRRMRPDLTNHNTVLANAGAAGAWTMALVVKECINHLRLGPDVITYNGSISACHKAPLGGKGWIFLEVKREFGKAPNSKNPIFYSQKMQQVLHLPAASRSFCHSQVGWCNLEGMAWVFM